jgi:hypothetical protein
MTGASTSAASGFSDDSADVYAEVAAMFAPTEVEPTLPIDRLGFGGSYG